MKKGGMIRERGRDGEEEEERKRDRVIEKRFEKI